MGANQNVSYDDPKIQKTLELLESGKTKQEIADHFGHGWSGVDMYFRRKGFRWDGKTFVPQTESKISAQEESKHLATKAGQVIRQLNQTEKNIRQIARRNGFETVDELGEYMLGQGYRWNNEIENYEYTEVAKVEKERTGPRYEDKTSAMDDQYVELLQFLASNREKLEALLGEAQDGTLPRYRFRGAKANKTLAFPTSLMTLLSDFSNEFNVTQRDVVEVALAEFFMKYGYAEQLDGALRG
ncbi:hypothetical protein [Exiguobacterium sp. s195]|uniref:hypothetical protein n=1 Tax=Exiguobacterium sp. s195 TaxID=2751282 RepID=UPI001BE6C0F8|nr:hypothetical protein [Exiguobacterium sp. s195]